jgi:hypothetical protein
MTPGREYGIGKYGCNTYDRFRVIDWTPEIVPSSEIRVTLGREYGIGKYGCNTYDHFRVIDWTPEVILPSEIQVPHV